MMKRIAIFASGEGTNAENIYKYFEGSKSISVVLLLTNNKKAGVLKKFNSFDLDRVVFSKNQMNYSTLLEERLLKHSVDLIVLAGFLFKIPQKIIDLYENRIINVHPSLLPKYGGRGMYGLNVHKTVLENKERESGITFHYVNEGYDEGEIIHQEKCVVTSDETPFSLQHKIKCLEKEIFPKIIEKLLK